MNKLVNFNKAKSFLQTDQSNKLLLLSVILIWGYAWVTMKMSLEYTGPFTFSAFRFLIGALTLLLILFWKRVPRPKKKLWGPLILLGIFQTTLVYIFVMTGMRFVDAGKSSVILYSMPLWSAILASKFLNEKVSWIRGVGVGLGVVGLSFVIGIDVWKNQNMMVLMGEGFIVLAAVIWAAANIYHKKVFAGENQLTVTTYQMLFGMVGLFLAALLMERNEPIIVNVTSISLLLFTGILASAFCFSVWFYLLEKLDTNTLTNASLLVPIAGIVASYFSLQEPVTLEMFFGAMLILIGIMVNKNDQLIYKKLKLKTGHNENI
ncbi:DMT family transporter [Alkalihalobacterium alkalinitrilicum]|uniref:DMT family transporter n=1 Tax=Alkalihalobacterium alkalinitrilicum TaxID=427920 RepID=UPI00114D7C07|nr:DMT family transporter [Alkalihalobacterium alkalinitrilicum]